MTLDNVNAVISRAAMDPDFRQGFFNSFDQAVAGYELTESEKKILRELTPGKLNTMVLKLQEWGEPPGAASLELMRFLFGEKAGQVIQEKQKSRATVSRALILAGALVLVAILAIGAFVAFSSISGDDRGGGRTGRPTDAPEGGGVFGCSCTCKEERGFTICTDCNGDRCVP